MCLCLFIGDSLSVEGAPPPFFMGPIINSLSVYSGPLGTSVTITGLGFSTTGNQIKFGETGSEYNPEYNLPSTDENRKITFTVPSYIYYKCMNDIPKCTVRMDVIPQGTYPITVVNEYGTSTNVNFTVTGSGSNTPSIRVISPNSGFESIEQGSKVEIQWTSNIPSNEMVIVYVSDGINRGNNNLVLNTGNFIYTIDERLPPNSNYKAYVYLASDTVIVDSSDKSFTIKARSSCPTGYTLNGSSCIPTNYSVTVLSPNSGFESIEQGGKVEIRWTSNIPSSEMVTVYVGSDPFVPSNKGRVMTVLNTGNVIYPLDSLPPGSNYKANVFLSYPGIISDSSDKSFTIKAKSNTYPPGCTSYFGYSTTTGQFCGNSGNIPKPVITFVSQTSGPVGTNLVIKGTNFSSNTNKIMFGDYAFNLPAYFYNSVNSEGSISFAVPKMLPNVACIQAPCYSSYIISIENSNGKSNETRFTITDGPVVDQGCSKGEVYSTTTGQKCPTHNPTYPPGCTSNNGYSTTTGKSCGTVIVDQGCSKGEVYSTTTGQKCPTPDTEIQECSATKFTRALRYGSRNNQVDALQTILIDKGYLDESYATGLFSSRTRTALKLLQSTNGLNPDGSVGPFTRALLNNLWKTQCIADQDDDN